MTNFNPDGPHGPGPTREAGIQIAELVRYLNYATRTGQGGLEDPADAERLLGDIAIAAERLPQLLDQVAAFLREQARGGILSDDHGRDADTLTAVACGALITGTSHAEALAGNLRKAREQIAGLYVKEGEDD